MKVGLKKDVGYVTGRRHLLESIQIYLSRASTTVCECVIYIKAMIAIKLCNVLCNSYEVFKYMFRMCVIELQS